MILLPNFPGFQPQALFRHTWGGWVYTGSTSTIDGTVVVGDDPSTLGYSRRFVFVVSTCVGGGSDSVDSVTIAGASMTKIMDTSDYDTGSVHIAVHYKEDNSGNSHFIASNWTTSVGHPHFTGFSIYTGPEGLQILDTQYDNTVATGGILSLSLNNVVKNGMLFAAAHWENGAASSWTGFAEIGDFETTSADWYTYAGEYPAYNENSRTVTVNCSDDFPDDGMLIGMSLGPG